MLELPPPSRPVRPTRRSAAALVMLAMAALTLVPACGVEQRSTAHGAAASGAGEDPDQALHAAIQQRVKAFSEGDMSTAASSLSERCRAVVDMSQLRRTVTAYEMMYPPLTATNARVERSGSEAVASYSLGFDFVPAVDQERWVQDPGGGWRWDAC